MSNIIDLFKEIGTSGLIDIGFVTLLICVVLVWLKKTRAGPIITGVIIVGIVYALARQFNLELTATVLKGFFAVILVALIIIFQQEIRYFFEQIGAWGLNPNVMRRKQEVFSTKEIQILVRTLTDLAKDKIGALIVIRGKDILDRHLHGCVELEGKISEPLIRSLFDPHSIGHDGAVVIDNGRITKFSCHLPLSKHFNMLANQGTRHAAALGLAELTDALCLVVSEERGTISIARSGQLRQIGFEQLNLQLESYYEEMSPSMRSARWHDIFTRDYKANVLSLILAVALWFIFIHDSKFIYKSFDVPIKHTQMPPGYQITEMIPDEVTVTFLGPRRAFYFFNKNEIDLLLKTSEFREGTKTIRISESSLSIPKSMSLENIAPREVEVRIEKSTSNQ
ncbi:MAG: diadenylate cyclase [Thermodesulfobacteriota bacterium]